MRTNTKLVVANNRSTVKTSISLEPDILNAGKMLAELAGYGFSFSSYVAALIREKEQCLRQPLKPQLVSQVG